MATGNFKLNKYYSNICFSKSIYFNRYMEHELDYIGDTKEEKEKAEQDYWDVFGDDIEEALYNDILNDIEEINRNLEYCKLELSIGYYEGFIINVVDYEHAYTYNEEQRDEEFETINQILEDIRQRHELYKIINSFSFSNGETFYSIIDCKGEKV